MTSSEQAFQTVCDDIKVAYLMGEMEKVIPDIPRCPVCGSYVSKRSCKRCKRKTKGKK